MTISTYPYNAVCLIETDTPGAGGARGSGVIVGPHTILTASHMLWDADAGAGATSFNVFPGYNESSDDEPTSGQLPGREVAHYYKVDDKGHVETTFMSQYDFAIIDTSADLSSYGSYGMTADFTSGAAELTGYPAANQHIQYKINGNVSTDANYNVLNYDNFKSIGGYSGGPVWVNRGTAAAPLPYVVGVASTTDHAAKLTADDLNTIKQWQAADSYLWSGAPHTFARRTQLNSLGKTVQLSGDDNQTLFASTDDTFNVSGHASTFVFNTGYGHDRIEAFEFGGPTHDTVSLPDTAATHLGAIIDHATTDAQGDSTLHLGNHDAITFSGVSVADLKQHKGDFTFHA